MRGARRGTARRPAGRSTAALAGRAVRALGARGSVAPPQRRALQRGAPFRVSVSRRSLPASTGQSGAAAAAAWVQLRGRSAGGAVGACLQAARLPRFARRGLREAAWATRGGVPPAACGGLTRGAPRPL